MSRMTSYFGARRRNVELAPMVEEPFAESRSDVFSLIPPRVETLDRFDGAARFENLTGFESAAPLEARPSLEAPPSVEARPSIENKVAEPEPAPMVAASPRPKGCGRHPIDMTDLSRLSIDTDNRLHWDGKPVETTQRLSLSRGQAFGVGLIGLFIVLGGVASAVQGSTAAYDWVCRLGWVRSYCPAAPAMTTPLRSDIPA